MPDREQNSDFMIEKIKDRPVNKRRLFLRTLITAAMAAMFGLVACVTFLLMEPLINKMLYPEAEPEQVVFPEDKEEMAPEDMLGGNLPAVNINNEYGDELILQVYGELSAYVNELNHSIVTVTGTSSNIDWFNNVQESKIKASGLIIANNNKELLVLVDYAPLRKAERMTMTFAYQEVSNTANKCQVPVELKQMDGNTGLAVLAASLSDIPSDMLGDNGIKVASLGSTSFSKLVTVPVVAVGSPMGNSGSVGYGMITSVNNQTLKADCNYKVLQTDIYGSSNASGFLFNMKGQVIGMITNDRVNVDMKNTISAYGISEIKKYIEKLSNGKKIAYAGLNVLDVTDDANRQLGVPYGAYVRNVTLNSPAMLAGIQQGDVIVRLHDNEIRNCNDYIDTLMNNTPGSTVKITIKRSVQGEYKEMEIPLELNAQ